MSNQPAVLELEAGTYHACTCGLSKNKPFCDGSHEGTEYTPKEFKLEEKKTVAICQCQHTGTSPFCDGSHNKL